jgi:hypothetical protein
MKILLGDLNAEMGREDIFKLTIGNEILHEINNDNGVRVVNFDTSKNLIVKTTMFQHRNIHKYTWTSPNRNTHIQIDHILIDRRRHSGVIDVRSFRAADCDTDHYLVVAKVRERLAVNKQGSPKFRMERFNLKKLNEVEGKEKYRVEVSNRCGVVYIGMREDTHVNIMPSPKGLVLEMEHERSGWTNWLELRRSGECSRSWAVTLLPEDCWKCCSSRGVRLMRSVLQRSPMKPKRGSGRFPLKSSLR